MTDTQSLSPNKVSHITIVGGATYEVNSHYIGKITFLDLLKQMLKRDLERQDEE